MNTDNPLYTLTQRLADGQPVWLDAGTGTELQARGAPMHPEVWCGMAHMTNPDTVREIHIDYIRAGADIITANTFSTNRNMMGPAGLGDQVVDVNRQAVERALEAREQAQAGRPIAVAGSMSHQIPIVPGTSQRRGAPPPVEELQANFAEIANTHKASGADMIMLEMMSDPAMAVHAIAAALDTGLPVWMGVSCKMSDDNQLLAYSRPDISFDDLCRQLIDPRLGAVGIMHSSINYVSPAIEVIRSHFNGPLMAYPDSGYFTMPEWNFNDIISPQDFSQQAQTWFDAGVHVLGGCCGMGVDHIAALTAGHNAH